MPFPGYRVRTWTISYQMKIIITGVIIEARPDNFMVLTVRSVLVSHS